MQENLKRELYISKRKFKTNQNFQISFHKPFVGKELSVEVYWMEAENTAIRILTEIAHFWPVKVSGNP